MRLRTHRSHLTYKVANEFRNVREEIEVVESNEYGPALCPVVL